MMARSLDFTENTVGKNQWPRSNCAPAGLMSVSCVAFCSRARAAMCFSLSTSTALMRGPMLLVGSVGSPTRSAFTLATNLSRNSSWILAWRYMRSLQVHTEPPKKNFEVTAASHGLVDVGVLHH